MDSQGENVINYFPMKNDLSKEKTSYCGEINEEKPMWVIEFAFADETAAIEVNNSLG